MNSEMRFAFRFERRTTGERAAWYTIGDGPEVGPLLVARRTHEKLATILSHAVAILTSVLTVEHSFSFRFTRQGSGGVLVWVTLGDGDEVGPLIPAAADVDRVGFLLAKAIVSLLDAESGPSSSAN
jgi:hypothetical protein